MTEPTVVFERATPVLNVADYPRARAFYRDRLGFRVIEEGGDPPRFGIIERGRAVLFLDAWHGVALPAAGSWSAYLHVQGLKQFHAEVVAAGIEISRALEETGYGMREFDIRDPDGHVLCFGEDLDREG